MKVFSPDIQALPTCPKRVPRPESEATTEDHAWARIDGVRIIEPDGEGDVSMFAYPKIPERVGAAAELLGCGCRSVELANWLEGSEVHRWFAVQLLGQPQIS